MKVTAFNATQQFITPFVTGCSWLLSWAMRYILCIDMLPASNLIHGHANTYMHVTVTVLIGAGSAKWIPASTRYLADHGSRVSDKVHCSVEWDQQEIGPRQQEFWAAGHQGTCGVYTGHQLVSLPRVFGLAITFKYILLNSLHVKFSLKKAIVFHVFQWLYIIVCCWFIKSFSAESFVFQVAVQKFKDQDI